MVFSSTWHKVVTIVTGLITIAAFWLANSWTETFNPDDLYKHGGNGNPALIITLGMLIYMTFYFCMIFVFEALHERVNWLRRALSIVYPLIFFTIVGFTYWRMMSFYHDIQPYYEYEIGLLNPYSNNLLFNVWTFIAGLIISAFLSLFTKKKPRERK